MIYFAKRKTYKASFKEIRVPQNTLMRNIIINDSAYEQTKFIIEKIEKVLQRAGGSLKDVIRTRLFVTDISLWAEYGRAHGEFFKDIRPCTSMIEISRLIEPEYMIEIEATAVLSD